MMNYTLAQQQAIQALDDNLQLIACAGSGKTQVISRRVVELLRAGNQPGEIAESHLPSPKRRRVNSKTALTGSPVTNWARIEVWVRCTLAPFTATA